MPPILISSRKRGRIEKNAIVKLLLRPLLSKEGIKGWLDVNYHQTLYNQHFQKGLRQELRKDMPKAEVILWSYLQNKQLGGFKFRRQHGINKYVVDFYCPKAKLVIEIDGDSHFDEGADALDRQRQTFIESLGMKVIRFTNQEIYYDLESVLIRTRTALRLDPNLP